MSVMGNLVFEHLLCAYILMKKLMWNYYFKIDEILISRKNSQRYVMLTLILCVVVEFITMIITDNLILINIDSIKILSYFHHIFFEKYGLRNKLSILAYHENGGTSTFSSETYYYTKSRTWEKLSRRTDRKTAMLLVFTTKSI